MNDNRAQHIPKENLRGTLTPAALSHLFACRFCQDELAGYVEEHELIKAPCDLKGSILKRAEKLDVRLIAGTNHASKKLQLFYFSLKVGTAVLCSLTLLLAAPAVSRQLERDTAKASFQSYEDSKNQWELYKQVENFTALFSPFEHMEVNSHDKKEK